MLARHDRQTDVQTHSHTRPQSQRAAHICTAALVFVVVDDDEGVWWTGSQPPPQQQSDNHKQRSTTRNQHPHACSSSVFRLISAHIRYITFAINCSYLNFGKISRIYSIRCASDNFDNCWCTQERKSNGSQTQTKEEKGQGRHFFGPAGLLLPPIQSALRENAFKVSSFASIRKQYAFALASNPQSEHS